MFPGHCRLKITILLPYPTPPPIPQQEEETNHIKFDENYMEDFSKAYIPLQRKSTRVGASCWSRPPMRLALGIPTCWYLPKTTLYTPNATTYLPNAKSLRWPCRFHVYCVVFICVWCPTRTPFPVEYGL